jgi:hypothetical protein
MALADHRREEFDLSTVNDFVAELVRAANEVQKLSDFERRRLFERAVTTIREMRETIGIPSAEADADRIVELQVMVAARGVRAMSPEEVREGLLTAAGMIRDLHILLDTGTEIDFSSS